MLRLVVERMIEIDVEIKIEDGYAMINQEDTGDMFDMEVHTKLSKKE